ncbi:MAG: DNA topoisomerase I [Anaerolineae bacterium]
MHQLIHNGIIVPDPEEALGLSITIRGVEIPLTPAQEEMALAWARKLGTPYVKDVVFQTNFLSDFTAALGYPSLPSLDEIVFTSCIKVINKERYHLTHMGKEKRKALALERKAQREALKARFGYAIVDGQRVELGNYMTEPSGLFMGRGEHPLRGRWKQGARQSDVTLNLSPDAPRPAGDWGAIVWQPESLWVARWDDRLSDKTKYIWLADTTPVKQTREAHKFDKAQRLEAEIDLVRASIQESLADPQPKTRMLATVCYLIDILCLRVGDEKDPDEADTVGATTLRPEHIKILKNGKVEFHFLGKDSVEWRKKILLPELVRRNLEELIQQARPSGTGAGAARNLPQLFPDIGSVQVNRYLSSLLPGLSAKVFRTYRATNAVSTALEGSGVKESSPEYAKWKAVAAANLQAAELCNHTKKAVVNWAVVQTSYQVKLDKAAVRLQAALQAQDETRRTIEALREQLTQMQSELDSSSESRKFKSLRARIQQSRSRLAQMDERTERARLAVGKITAQMEITQQKRTWNLGTSLKSYIDPRVYHHWGESVQYDVIAKYYPTILQRKFAWVRLEEERVTRAASDHLVLVRTCMPEDLPKVAQVFLGATTADIEVDLPTTPSEIGQRYLPSLEKPWCEALAAFSENGEAIGFAVLGPVWVEGKEEHLDLFGILLPGEMAQSTADALSGALQTRFRAYQAHNPKHEFSLLPQQSDWCKYAAELADALGFAPDEEALETITCDEPDITPDTAD